jgi:hypothetical protein
LDGGEGEETGDDISDGELHEVDWGGATGEAQSEARRALNEALRAASEAAGVTAARRLGGTGQLDWMRTRVGVTAGRVGTVSPVDCGVGVG